MRRADKLDAIVEALEEGVEVEAHVAQVVVQRDDVRVEAAKYHPAPGRHPGHALEAERALVWLVLHLALLRDGDQVALHGVGPAVVGADKAFGVAVVDPAHGLTPVRAAVDVGVEPTIHTPGQDDRCLAHVRLHEIARVANLRLVPEKQP